MADCKPETVKLTVEVWGYIPIWKSVLIKVWLIASTMAIPLVNELLLSGHWAVHLWGGFFGLAASSAVLKRHFSPKHGTFDTTEEAVEWVKSEEWKQDW